MDESFKRFIDELEWALEYKSVEQALRHAIECVKSHQPKEKA